MRMVLTIFVTLLLGTSGCLPVSVEPFYTDECAIPTPKSVIGNWQVTRGGVIDQTGSKARGLAKARPWVWSEKCVLTHDSQNIPSSLRTVFFKIGTNSLYCDVTIGSPGNEGAELNEYWAAHIIPVHTLFRADIGQEEIRFYPLRLDYVRNVAKMQDGGSLIESPSDSGLYGTSSNAWVKFLATHGEEKNAFSQEDVIILKRAVRSAAAE